ncbi:homocysteine S-methyltransferase family protein [Granulicella sp. S190]|uniref:homocysteine S-methyltransferase family protein n=1 Tax=Granulicella sp. S190 TaxID=1747226 RepID=UPI00131ED010|nr:homocysteine S-methyltransferase family protein [Granulicella sp. S190]
MNFSERLESSPVILTEGAVVTRLNYEFHLSTPDSAAFVHLFDRTGRAALDAISRSYMQIAADHDLPMLVSTPTWRAHPEGLARQGFTATNDLARVNHEAVSLLHDMRRDMGLEETVYISGAVGPQFDGYDSKGRLMRQRQRLTTMPRRRY